MRREKASPGNSNVGLVGGLLDLAGKNPGFEVLRGAVFGLVAVEAPVRGVRGVDAGFWPVLLVTLLLLTVRVAPERLPRVDGVGRGVEIDGVHALRLCLFARSASCDCDLRFELSPAGCDAMSKADDILDGTLSIPFARRSGHI